MIDRSVVIAAYRILLGREPESEEIIRLHQAAASPEEMLTRFVNSSEFATRQAASRIDKLLRLPAEKVEASADPAILRTMISQVGQVWTRFGAEDPHWSVLTDPRFRAELIDQTKADFYQTGALAVEYFRAAVSRAGETLSDKSTCFELGAGVGRITAALAPLFERLIACDISKNHLVVAEEHLLAMGFRNISYFHLKDVQSVRSAPSFDALFSIIVLQHNPPPIIAVLLQELLNKLNPGGIGYFQVPTYLDNYSFDVAAYLKCQEGLRMEMHALSQRDVFNIIALTGCSVLEVREDSWTGLDGVSNSFLVRKNKQDKL